MIGTSEQFLMQGNAQEESYAAQTGHEQIIEQLSTILIQLNGLQAMMEEERPDIPTVREGMKTIEQIARESLSIMRTADENLPPPELQGVTLAEALSRLVEETAESLDLSSRVSFSGVDEQGRPKEHTLTTMQERLIYLVAREALYQVQQHTGVRKLRFVLNYGSDDVQMTIEDDGTLLVVDATGTASNDPATRESALSALTVLPQQRAQYEPRPYIDLRHRIAHLGGTLDTSLSNEQQGGTRVFVRLPYTEHTHTSDDKMVVQESPRQDAQVLPSLVNTSTSEVTQVRVLVVESQAVTRAGLRRLLESYKDLQVVGEAADGVQAVSETLELGPQVVLMDSQLPNGQSMEALRQIKQLNLDTKVLLLSTQDREEYLYETLRAGADGYVLKDIAPDDLAAALRVVARGEVLVQPQLANRLLSRVGKQGQGRGRNELRPYEVLTARELDVLRLLARGLRNKEIASRLYVSERTVNFHLANIYQKLNVSGRTEALSKAIEQGLVTT
jgi:DNA-binding NarL/FixJ family response regulator